MIYQPHIGLEIHTELKTKSKMFCRCLNDPLESHPNINVCPICLAHPGTLPQINKEAVRKVMLLGLALESKINRVSFFERKNYFYPDLPKGYQISQYQTPICLGGELPLYLSDEKELKNKKIKIRRIHLEEDTAKLIHLENPPATLVDFNRAGVPLMELVTEPVIQNGLEARFFAEGLKLLLKELMISDADMEKGEMRVEVNISLSTGEALGTKVEIKNLNSFRSVEKAIDFEIERQKELLEKGEKIIQETRGYNEEKNITYSQRTKEEAEDYRYFPEPDLPPMVLYGADGLFDLEELKIALPELPWQKKERILKLYGLNDKEANLMILEAGLLDYFEKAISELKTLCPKEVWSEAQKILYNYLVTDLKGLMAEFKNQITEIRITPTQFSQLISLILEKKISSRVAKDVLREMFQTGQSADQIVKEKNLETIIDQKALLEVVDEVIKANPHAVNDYLGGKDSAIQFLVGQAMAKLKGAANPKELERFLREKLIS